MHIYELNGRKYPSVTTIIHSLGNDDLMKWSNIMGFKHRKLEDILKKSSEFGTLVHSHLQKLVDPSITKVIEPRDALELYELDKALNHFQKKFASIPYETIYTEKTLISPTLGYAGTLDWLAKMSNKIMLNDFKTSKQVQVTMLLQLGGYFNLLTDAGQTIDGASIITVNAKGCQMHPIGIDNLQFLGKAFQSLAEFYIMTFERIIAPEYEILEDLTIK